MELITKPPDQALKDIEIVFHLAADPEHFNEHLSGVSNSNRMRRLNEYQLVIIYRH